MFKKEALSNPLPLIPMHRQYRKVLSGRPNILAASFGCIRTGILFPISTARDVILIMQDTGMRPQDVFRMRWEHVNWEKRRLFIPYGKTRNSRRFVPLSGRVVDCLLPRVKNSKVWIFPSKRSRSGHLTTVANQWRLARKAAGLDASVKLYCCRHTFATDVLERTGNLAAVMKALGHADAQTAMKYQHPGLEQIRKAVEDRNREQAALAERSGGSPHKSPHSRVWVN